MTTPAASNAQPSNPAAANSGTPGAPGTAAAAVDPAAGKPGEAVTTDPAKAGEAKTSEQDDKGASKGADDKSKPEGAPEKYDFQAPEGVDLDTDLVGEFEAMAREDNLSQERAQRYVDIAAKIVTKQFEALQAVHTQWAEESRTDKEFGGDALEANLGIAKKAMLAFGGDAMRQLLDHTGYGNHPEVIRAWWKVGKAMSDDGLIRGNGAPAKGQKSTADVFYGSQT